jgi:DNA repair protein RecN (Recombination protein N)
MLRRLEIQNYGLIARAEIEFATGATIFTGETGSGKTMLLGALSFALGARAGSDVVGRNAGKTSVTLAFDPGEALRTSFAQAGFELDDGEEATIVREIGDNGRSSVRLNGRAATAGYVREIGDRIAEIVGQHEAQRLLSPAYHLELLDRFAGGDALQARDAVARAFERSGELARSLERLHSDERAARERYDEASFSAGEIDDARVQPGEDERLEQRRRYLDNVERIAAALRAAHDALAGDESSATGALGAASVALAHVAEIDGDLASVAQQSAALQSETGELATRIARALDETEFDPAELETINERLDVLDRLKRKYGGTLARVLERADEMRAIVEAYEGRDRRATELAEELDRAERDLKNAAQTLTGLRKSAAKKLSQRVVAEFGDLALASGRFDAALEPLDRIGPDGAERVEFLFAANAGESARPLARVASGGELSRVLLASIVVLSGARPTNNALVFDEIDAGIGGATATAVGARIGRLARDSQVICVTHLAQLATWAGRHYVLDKTEGGNVTTIGVRELRTTAEREIEIARMLSGESHDIARRHAREMLSAQKLL